jgi:hypothetical protein
MVSSQHFNHHILEEYMRHMEESLSFHRSYGGFLVDRRRPVNYEIKGSIVCVIGALIIFYSPR